MGEEETAFLSEHPPDCLHRPTRFLNPFDPILTYLSLFMLGQHFPLGVFCVNNKQ